MRIDKSFEWRFKTIAMAAVLLAASVTTGCAAASSATAKENPSSSTNQSLTNANPQAPDATRCKEAVNDVTKYCKEGATSSKCDDAKARSRKFCMKTE